LTPYYRTTFFFVALQFFATFAFAQTSPGEKTPQTPTIKVRTEFVLIPAEVTNSKGNRVTDMNKEDFAVLEDGKPQEIAFFEHVTTKPEVIKPEPLPEGVFTNAVQQSRNRITIFVLDLLNSKIEEQREARKQLIEFLSNSLDVNEPVCLVAVDARGVWLLHGWTTDTKILVDAINHVKQQPTAMDRPASDPEDQLFRSFLGGHGRSVNATVASEETKLNMLQMTIGMETLDFGARTRLTLLSLLQIADASWEFPDENR